MGQPQELPQAVVRVGEGRGFIVDTTERIGDFTRKARIIITAAHCLPHLPPCHAMSYTDERTYPGLLGRLDAPAPTIWAECLFADPISDVAVLGCPDTQSLSKQAYAFEDFAEQYAPLSISDAGDKHAAWLLNLECSWYQCAVAYEGDGGLWIEEAAEPIRGGMSGSPILSVGGKAIGVVVVSGGAPDEPHMEGGPNPRLTHALPGWLLLRQAELARV